MLDHTRRPCVDAMVQAQPDVTDCGRAAGRWVLAATILGSSITFIDGTVVNVALPLFLLSRWAGGLVAHYGSKLPLVIGPIVASVGFALFALPGAEAGSYWKAFFPAVMVMSIGMSISVAPLTTTVMGAVEERYAGVASGINNAVSRTASLLAVAVFGIVMLHAFRSSLTERLHLLPVSSVVRSQLVAQSVDLVNIRVPAGVTAEAQTAIDHAIRESFIAGFRLVAYIAAGLAALSALAAWLLIEGKPRSESEPSPSNPDHRGTSGKQPDS